MGGPVRLNGVVVYGYSVADGDGVRVRISTDAAERLGLSPGRQVRLEGSRREGGFLLAGAEGHPPVGDVLVASPRVSRMIAEPFPTEAFRCPARTPTAANCSPSPPR